jgi:predicted outer membrane repeat protein
MDRKANQVRWLSCALLLPAVACMAAQGAVIYVDANADGLNVGTSWEHAIDSLQDALLLAYFSDKPVEIRVAEGTYTPDQGLGIMPGDTTASFQLIDGVTIKGGYAANLSGHRGQPDVRDHNLYKSILSGDLNGDDGPELDTIDDNSDHVVTSSENDRTAMLDGFTISGSGIGRPSASPNDHTGGMYNDSSGPTLVNCTFTGNLAAERGAGMYNNRSNPTLLNCTFSENSAPDRGAGMYNADSGPVLINCVFAGNTSGMSGGGMYNEKSVPTLTNCTFTNNSTGGGGGGAMYNEESTSMLADCRFRDNSTQGSGAGLYNNASKLMLLGCTFGENLASRGGGGLYNDNASETSLTHCIFSGNQARDGGGIENLRGSSSTLLNCTLSANHATHAGGGIYSTEDGFVTLVNCILWGDTPDEILGADGGGRTGLTTGVRVSNSDVQNGWQGNNLDSDPLFVDPNNGDFHLKSQDGRWDPASRAWVIDEASSPCIDTGSPDEPVGLERFPNGDRINMGAYGGTPEASLTPQFLLPMPGRASNPSPDDGADNVDVERILSWTGGAGAAFHDVYLGTDGDAVTDSDAADTTGVYRGRLDSTSYAPSEALEWSQTYYWRIDEVDRDGRITTGELWTFTTSRPPKGRACFTADTGVWVDGELVPISEVAPRQSICRTDCLGTIQEVQQHTGIFACYDLLLESGNCITVAENHYFLAESGQWVSLHELKAGTKLKTSEGSVEIVSVNRRPVPYVGKVYNLRITGSDRYLVGRDVVIVRDH